MSGCLPMASERFPPEPMSSLMLPMTRLNLAFCCCSAMIDRHCSTGRPALIMVENWREKMATSATVTEGAVRRLKKLPSPLSFLGLAAGGGGPPLLGGGATAYQPP